jgi:heme oxygenase
MTTGEIESSLHGRLRHATEPLHRAAEEVFDAERRLSSMANYIVLLDQLWSLHAGVERGLQAHGPHIYGLELGTLRRSVLLALDLEAAARRAPRLEPVSVVFGSRSAAMGGLYVLEGSMLGGRILLPRARRALGVTEAVGGRFLAGDGANTGRRWRRLIQALGEIPARGQKADDAEGGAREVFARFIEVLRPCAVARALPN